MENYKVIAFTSCGVTGCTKTSAVKHTHRIVRCLTIFTYIKAQLKLKEILLQARKGYRVHCIKNLIELKSYYFENVSPLCLYKIRKMLLKSLLQHPWSRQVSGFFLIPSPQTLLKTDLSRFAIISEVLSDIVQIIFCKIQFGFFVGMIPLGVYYNSHQKTSLH